MAHPHTAEKNPFELRGDEEGPERKYPSRVWTAEEQAERLKGYLEVPPEYWENIRPGVHVRYVSKTEGYRPGGFVMKNPFDTKPRGGTVEKRFIKMQNGFNEKANGYASWVVAYEDTERIYVKVDASVLVMLHTMEAAVKGLNENIKKVAEYAKGLDQRLRAIEGRK